MIRIDFTDGEDKYVNTVYIHEYGLSESALASRLNELADLWSTEGRARESFPDYLCRVFDGFMPKPATVFHYQIMTKAPV